MWKVPATVPQQIRLAEAPVPHVGLNLLRRHPEREANSGFFTTQSVSKNWTNYGSGIAMETSMIQGHDDSKHNVHDVTLEDEEEEACTNPRNQRHFS